MESAPGDDGERGDFPDGFVFMFGGPNGVRATYRTSPWTTRTVVAEFVEPLLAGRLVAVPTRRGAEAKRDADLLGRALTAGGPSEIEVEPRHTRTGRRVDGRRQRIVSKVLGMIASGTSEADAIEQVSHETETLWPTKSWDIASIRREVLRERRGQRRDQ